jgi:hypothetical protein
MTRDIELIRDIMLNVEKEDLKKITWEFEGSVPVTRWKADPV